MIVDLGKTAEQTGIDDKDTLKMLFSEFFNVCQADIDKLPGSITSSNFDEVKLFSHNIKGAARNLWMEEIGNAAEILEKLAKNSDWTPMVDAYKNLLAVYNQGKEEFSKI